MKKISINSRLVHNFVFCFLSSIYFFIYFNRDYSAKSLLWIGINASLIIYIFFKHLLHNGKFTINKFCIWVLSFCVFSFISIIWAIDKQKWWDTQKSILLVTATTCFFSFEVESKKYVENVLRCIVIAQFTNFLYMTTRLDVIKLLLNAHRIGFEDLGTGWNANTIGLTAMITASICVYFSSKSVVIIYKLIWYILTAISLFFVLLSGSRKAFIGLFILLFLYKVKGSIIKRLAMLLIVGVVTVLIMLYVLNNPVTYNLIGYRLVNMYDGYINSGTTENSFNVRNLLIKEGILYWSRSPLYGIGLNNFRVFFSEKYHIDYYAHNNFIEMLSDLGIIGFFIYYYGYVRIIKNLFKKIEGDELNRYLSLLNITILVLQWGFVSYYGTIYWALLMVSYSMIDIQKTKESSQRLVDVWIANMVVHKKSVDG